MSAGKAGRQLGLPVTAGGNGKQHDHFEEHSVNFFRKLKIYLPYDSAVPPLVIYTVHKKMKDPKDMYPNVHSSFI